MPNLYGLDNSPSPNQLLTLATSVACPSGANTDILTTTVMTAVTQGVYHVRIIGSGAIIIGATPPTSININFRIGAGSTFNQVNIPGGTLAANGEYMYPIIGLSPDSGAAWWPLGSTVTISIQPAGQAVTAQNFSWNVYIGLERGPDQ